MAKGYEIGVYYFPNWHPDARNEALHGKGWTEWDILKGARPHFPGHKQPKVPLWGYEDESKPEVMEKKIAAALEYGISLTGTGTKASPFWSAPWRRAF